MKFTIFSQLAASDKSEETALLELQRHQQLASFFKQRYQVLSSVVPIIDDEYEAKDISFAISELNREFTEINQNASKFINEKERNLNKALEFVRKYDDVFNAIEPVYQKYRDKISTVSPSVESIYREMQSENKQYINTLNAQWSTLQNNLTEQINKGIESLLEVKLTLGITGSFKGQIESEISRNKRSQYTYFFLFISTLLLIPIFVGGIYFVEELKTLKWGDLLLIKLSAIIPLVWVARWFSKNYAHARLASIKFDHLNRLLGEGASTIAKLVEVDSAAKSEVYRRFAELFLDIKDLESIAVTQPKHPIEDLKEIAELTKRLKDL